MPRRIHEREKLVTAAEIELRKATMKAAEDLTQGEYLRVLVNVLAGVISSIAKYAIREERHGDPDTPGGLAP